MATYYINKTNIKITCDNILALNQNDRNTTNILNIILNHLVYKNTCTFTIVDKKTNKGRPCTNPAKSNGLCGKHETKNDTKEPSREKQTTLTLELSDTDNKTLPYYYTPLQIIENQYGNYEHALTHLVFRVDTTCETGYKVWGKQTGPIVLPLTENDIELCINQGWVYILNL